MKLLDIKKLKVNIGSKTIIKGLDLDINPGEIHALMGPNGSGKSTLASTIMGHPNYKVKFGSIKSQGKSIKSLSPEERAKLGIFLSFQYPVEVPGLSVPHFLRSAYNSLHPKTQLPPLEFSKYFETKMKLLNIKKDLADRSLNEGFSGGEKKKLEILQLAILNPKLAILDETDSGLDIDALRAVAEGIKKIKKDNKKIGILIITHYFRILQHIKPDFVHIMKDGQIIKSGRKELATQVEKKGYDWIK
ncbi:MAG: Fe-S cluster assembly ATPase SufC [bacterium]|nr:Fe-S cluster assembly ATPase SufC [bacterium]